MVIISIFLELHNWRSIKSEITLQLKIEKDSSISFISLYNISIYLSENEA